MNSHLSYLNSDTSVSQNLDLTKGAKLTLEKVDENLAEWKIWAIKSQSETK
jgi:hypothetical protein